LAAAEKAEGGIGGDHRCDLRPAFERTRQRAVMRAEIEHIAEPPFAIVETIEDAIGHLAMQEVDAAAPRRPVAVQPPGAAIEQCGGVGRCHRSRNRPASLCRGASPPARGGGLTNPPITR